MEPIPEFVNQIAQKVVDSAFQVHKALGPGLLESAYEVCLCHELEKHGLKYRSQVILPVSYDGLRLDAGYRLDVLVEEQIIIELKAVERVEPLHKAQLITYLKLSKLRLGFLINFNVELIKSGIIRSAM